MFLQPKKVKYKKTRKGKLNLLDFKSNKVRFGEVGLKAAHAGLINARQIEAARKVITKKIKRKGKVWIRIFPHTSVTAKASESRMGKGKGSVSYWAAKVSAGTTLFEVCGVPYLTALDALRAGSTKLSVKTKVFD